MDFVQGQSQLRYMAFLDYMCVVVNPAISRDVLILVESACLRVAG